MHGIDLLSSIRCITKAHEGVLKKIGAEFCLSLLEVKVISFLHNHPEQNTAGDIAEYRMLSKGNVSRAVESLIRRGWMERTPDTVDRRRVYLRLLPASKPITDTIDREWKIFYQSLFRNFSEEEIGQYDRFKEKLMQNARAILQDEERGDRK